ncbi:MAG: hypothetical protein EAZ63_03650 [Runella slithyformis]|nr:MAG: hypothetical protein EAZ63_03650 [Runella slithyformis]
MNTLRKYALIWVLLVVQVVQVGLKCAGWLAWSWGWVMWPVWLVPVVLVVLVAALFVVGTVQGIAAVLGKK